MVVEPNPDVSIPVGVLDGSDHDVGSGSVEVRWSWGDGSTPEAWQGPGPKGGDAVCSRCGVEASLPLDGSPVDLSSSVAADLAEGCLHEARTVVEVQLRADAAWCKEL